MDYSWFIDDEGYVRDSYNEKEYKTFSDEEKERIEFSSFFITDDDTRKMVLQFLTYFLLDIKKYKFGPGLRRKYTKLEKQQMEEFIHEFWTRLLNIPCDQLLHFVGLDKNVGIAKNNENNCTEK